MAQIESMVSETKNKQVIDHRSSSTLEEPPTMKKNVHLCTFSTTVEDWQFQDLELRQLRLEASARRFGITQIFSWNRQLLKKTAFYRAHRRILDQSKGAGFWLWKPYIILDSLRKIKDGDFLIYSDTSLYFINDPQVLMDLCAQNQGFFLVSANFENTISSVAKRDVFHWMQMDQEKYHRAISTQAYFQIYQKNPQTLAFVSEMLNYCENEHIITDLPNTCGKPNLPDFQDHKGDMPVLSLLSLKHQIPLFRDPSPWGNHHKLPAYRQNGEWIYTSDYDDYVYKNSPYPTILHWDKSGRDCARPWQHFLQARKMMGKLRRWLTRGSQ